MDAKEHLRIVEVDRIGGAIIVYFNDEKCAIYPASLLHEFLSRAREIDQSETQE
jgi:hypothetical protein